MPDALADLAAVRHEPDAQERRVKLIQQKLDRLDHAFFIQRSIDAQSFERQRDRLLVELTLAQTDDPAEATAVCGRWARRWRLCGPSGQPVAWVVSAAMDSLEMWRKFPSTAGRAFALPSGGAWWDDGRGPDRVGSARWRQSRPLRWLVLRVCGDLGAATIAKTWGVDPKVVEREVRRQATALGIHLVRRRAGRPPVE
ncbi:MAG: hypothetical protein FJ197_12970 [Gammaproteobacteria bacterium]|nr:hypothetical protein [Gammaproteobacteria bacterium]